MISSCVFVLISIAYTSSAPIAKIFVDLTYVFDETTQNYPAWKKYEMEVKINGTFKEKNWLQYEEIYTGTHVGTHMDAPSHFSYGGKNIDDIPVEQFIAPAAVVDITDKAAVDRDAMVTVDDLLRWENVTGHSLDGTVILFRTGWGKYWNNRTAYIGTDSEDPHNVGAVLHFPGLDPVAAQWLVDNRKVRGIGIDTMSFDIGASTDFESHRILLGDGYFGLENVANLEKLPIYGATIYVMPMKLGRASGAPTRIVATYADLKFGGVRPRDDGTESSTSSDD